MSRTEAECPLCSARLRGKWLLKLHPPGGEALVSINPDPKWSGREWTGPTSVVALDPEEVDHLFEEVIGGPYRRRRPADPAGEGS